jgi:hypothetical protein
MSTEERQGPEDDYEAPKVEDLEADAPAVSAAGTSTTTDLEG